MSWGAIGAAGVGAVGGILAGGNEEHIGPGDIMPRWLHDDQQRVGESIMNLPTPEYYGGQLIADQNPYMQQALAGMGGYGDGRGGRMADLSYLAGIGGLNQFGEGMRHMDRLAGDGFMYDQGTFDQTMGNLMPGLQGAYDAATRDITRDLNWNTLPGIDMASSQLGLQGNSKVGQASALERGMAADRAADVGSALWMNAANQAHEAAMRGGLADLDLGQNLVGQYANYGNMGGQMLNQGYNMGLSNLGVGMEAGQAQQLYDQSLIDAEMDKWNYNQMAPWIATEQQNNMILAHRMGSTPHTTGASAWETGLQGLQAGLGIYSAGQDAGWWGQVPGWEGGYSGSGGVWNGGYDAPFEDYVYDDL